MDNESKKIKLLQELVKWTKVTSIPQVKQILLDTLQSPEEVVAYQLSDGRASGKISKKVGVSFVTITEWWKKWQKLGIAESISARGGTRAQRSFSLEDFDIEIPTINLSKSKSKTGGK